jgi:CHAD domain-containing protein
LSHDASTQTYEGGRDLSSISEFAKEQLTKVFCSVRNLDVCSDEEKAVIAELRAKSKEELEAIVATVAERMAAASEAYDKAVEEIQEIYESKTQEFNEESEAIRKETSIKLVNQILSIDHPESEGIGNAAAEL